MMMVAMMMANDMGTIGGNSVVLVSGQLHPWVRETGTHTHVFELLVQSHGVITAKLDVIHPEYTRNERKRYLSVTSGS